MEERTVEGNMHISEPVTLKGLVTLTLFDKDGNEVSQQRHNLITSALKSRVLGPLAGVPQSPLSSTLITRFAFGAANTAPVASNTALGHELFRKPITASTISGDHFVADCNIGFNELNTLTATITALNSATSIVLDDTLGLQAGDMLEINNVSTVGNTTNAQFVQVAGVSGFNVTLAAPGLNLSASPTPSVGWFAMQLVREAGVLMSVNSAIILSTPAPTFNSFAVNNPGAFSPGQTVSVPVNASFNEVAVIQSVSGSLITLTGNLLNEPPAGGIVENGTLANHATGFTFRKTNALTAIARVDFSMA